MQFRILGPLWVTNEGREITPTAPKVRQVLSFLLMRCGRLVQVGELIDELWGEEPPRSSMTTLQTYIYKLRKDLFDHTGSAELLTRVSGYLLDLAPELGDLHQFELLSQEGRAALEQGDAARASDRLSAALSLWRGPALADVAVGEVLSAYVTRLEEERLRVLEQRITADLELGRHEQLVSELKMLISNHPMNERYHAHLMVALSKSGRRSEGLMIYQQLRRMLVDELGMEPSPPIQRLHLTLLNSDDEPADDRPKAIVATVPPAASTSPVPVRSSVLLSPAQLPPDIPNFVGEKYLLGLVERDLLDPAGGTIGRTVCISGMPGSGKSALAIRAGHANRAPFSGGQLYADLRGSTASPADPGEVLGNFLRAIGVSARDIPDSLAERSKIFRTWSMERSILVVLDDAASASQVTPLLPTSPNGSVIVTSRSGLYDLLGAHHVELGQMPLDEAVQLIASSSSRQWSGTDLAATERVAELCGRLPIALRSSGARLAVMRNWPMEKLAARLEDPASRLELLSSGDLDVRARLASGYERLDPRDQSLFRLISLLHPLDFTAETVAQLVGVSLDDVEARLARLGDSGLLMMAGSNGGSARYSMHELVRIYARERLDREFRAPAPAPESAHANANAPTNAHAPAPAVPVALPALRGEPPRSLALVRSLEERMRSEADGMRALEFEAGAVAIGPPRERTPGSGCHAAEPES